MRSLFLAPALLLAAGAASAEGFTIHDFGTTATREECLSKAVKVMEAYRTTYGGFSVEQVDWVAYGWDLTPGDQDVAILCPVLPDGQFNAFMVVYGETDNDQERESTADRIAAFWGGN